MGNHPVRTKAVVRTAARPIYRGTTEKALREFLARVECVNSASRLLGRVNRVVLFASMLHEEVDRLNDVDFAVEVVAKIADHERLAASNRNRLEALALGNGRV